MSADVFGQTYAGEYDELYRDKDYAGECDLIEAACRRFAPGGVRSILDLGCGTGNHTIPLAERGYRLTGVDRSAGMLDVARRKAAGRGVDITWVEGDIRQDATGGSFDAALCMFAVLGYLEPNDDVMAAFSMVRRQVRAGGLLMFDVWYGPAVLTLKPADRTKVIPVPGGQVIRVGTSTLDTSLHMCTVEFHLWRLRDGRVEGESQEVHRTRYFFPLELELMLSTSGFALLSLTAFPSLDRPADVHTWNVFAVARAV